MNYDDSSEMISDLVTEQIRLKEWLKDQDMKYNPFEPVDAKDEVNLGECFVHPAGFAELLDKQSMILYAPFGGGKTASCRMTNHYCDFEIIADRVFSVEYNDLQRVIEEAHHDLGLVTARAHVEAILRSAVPKLFDYLVQHPKLADNFENLTNLKLFINRFSHCLVDYRLNQTLRGTGVTKKQIIEIVTPKYDFDQLIVRMGIPPDLYRRLRITLLSCDCFNSNCKLRTVFADRTISSWQDNLPGAGNPASRVMTTISYLYDKYNTRGENVLVLFLRALLSHIPPEDRLHSRIEALAIELERELGKLSPENTDEISVSSSEADAPEQFVGIDNLLSEILEYEDYRRRVRFVANLLAQDVDEISLDDLSPAYLLKKFRDLVKKVGFEAVFVLVDNVDGLPETDNNPEACVKLLTPLIGTAALMNLSGMFFKFFLPLEVKSLIEKCQFKAFRRGHMNYIVVEWSNEKLHQILWRRVESAKGTEEGDPSLDPLCETNLRGMIERELVAHATTPRELLILVDKILKTHIQRVPAGESKITREDVDLVLGNRSFG